MNCVGIFHKFAEQMNMISTDDCHKLVLAFIPLYNLFDIEVNGLGV